MAAVSDRGERSCPRRHEGVCPRAACRQRLSTAGGPCMGQAAPMAEDSSGSGYVEEGGFTRDTNYIPDRITADGSGEWPVEAGRYRLVIARACPWANRAAIVRR